MRCNKCDMPLKGFGIDKCFCEPEMTPIAESQELGNVKLISNGKMIGEIAKSLPSTYPPPSLQSIKWYMAKALIVFEGQDFVKTVRKNRREYDARLIIQEIPGRGWRIRKNTLTEHHGEMESLEPIFEIYLEDVEFYHEEAGELSFFGLWDSGTERFYSDINEHLLDAPVKPSIVSPQEVKRIETWAKVKNRKKPSAPIVMNSLAVFADDMVCAQPVHIGADYDDDHVSDALRYEILKPKTAQLQLYRIGVS
jgi:hypothetical protein